MCCVVGYVGTNNGVQRVLDGMARLEYRGYDSAGVAVFDALHHVSIHKVVGGVARLVQCVPEEVYTLSGATTVIGHTRWSTHGVVNEANAHPVFDCTHACMVVHNGIIENESDIRARLQSAGHVFVSQTDSELIAHLIEEQVRMGASDPHVVVMRVVEQLQGAYAFVAMVPQFPHQLLVARQRSPLCLVHTEEGTLIASDPIAAGSGTLRVKYIPEGMCGVVKAHQSELMTFTGEVCEIGEDQVAIVADTESAQGYSHIMLKEMYEQVDVLMRIAARVRGGFQPPWLAQMAQASRIICIGSGTSYHAALLLQMLLESIVSIPVVVLPASEARDVPYFDVPGSWVIALSQSGETADTLESMRFYSRKGLSTLAITNVMTSSMAREATAVLLLEAGVEYAVASTKTFVAHIALGYMLARKLAGFRHRTMSSDDRDSSMIESAARCLAENLASNQALIDHVIAPRIASWNKAIFMGRRNGYVMAAEAALKLKELAYSFTELHFGGELKHGPLALIEPGLPVVVCSALEPVVYRRLVANVQEVKARRGHVIAVAFIAQHEIGAVADDVIWLQQPQEQQLASIAMASVLQYIAYRVAVIRGCSVDKPRNLAKSVTVE